MTQTAIANPQTQTTTVATASALVEYHRFDGERSSIFKNIDESGRTLILIPVNCQGQAFGGIMQEIAEYYPEAHGVYRNRCQGNQGRLVPGKLVFSSTLVRQAGKMVETTDRRGRKVQGYRAGEPVQGANGQSLQSPVIFCFVPVKLTAGNRESASPEFAMQSMQRLVELQMQGYLQEIGVTEVRVVKLVTDKNPQSANHWESFGPMLLEKLVQLELPTTVYISADDREFYYDQSNNLVAVEAPQDHWTSERINAMM